MILTVAGEQINLDIETSSEGVVEEVLELKDGTQVKITVLQDLPYTSGDFEERTLEEIEGLPNISGSQVKNDDGLLVRGEMIAPEARASELVPVLAWSQTVDQMLVAVPEGSVIRSHVTAGGVRANSEEKFVLADDPIDFPQSVEIERDGILTEFHLATEADVDNAAPSVAVPFATTNTGVHFRYSTFIAPNRVDAPPACVGLKTGRKFNGNNRSWRTVSNTGFTSDKTRVSTQYTWSTKKLTHEFFVGRTYQYRADGSIEKQATASANGMKLTGIVSTSNSIRFRVDHKVKNPLCSLAGPISYYAVVTMWKGGNYAIQGNNVKVPSHEITVRPSGRNTNRIVRQSAAAKFICLNVGQPFCPSAQSFVLSGNY